MFPTYPLVIPMIPRCTYSPRRFRSISGTVTALQSLYLQSLPRLVAPMVLKVFDSKKDKEKKRISPLVAKDTAYYRFE